MLKGASAYEARYIRDDDLVETLTDDLGVLDKDDVEHKQCEGCGNIYLRDYDTCQKCGGNLEVFYNSFELNLSKSGTHRYFEKLVKDEGPTYYGQKREGIYGREFEFYQIGDEDEIVCVPLNVEGGNLTPGSAKYLRKSINPVLVLNPGIDKLQVGARNVEKSVAYRNIVRIPHIDTGALTTGFLPQRSQFNQILANCLHRTSSVTLNLDALSNWYYRPFRVDKISGLDN